MTIDWKKRKTVSDVLAEKNKNRAVVVDEERGARLKKGLVVSVDGYGDVAVRGGSNELATLTSLALRAFILSSRGKPPASFVYRDRDNIVHDLSPDQVIDLWERASGFAEDAFKASWKIKDQPEIPDNVRKDSQWP